MSAHERPQLRLQQSVASPLAHVWQAIVEPELQAHWLGMRLVSSWRVGEPVVLCDTPLGGDYVEYGSILVWEPPRHLVFSHFSPLWRIDERPEHFARLSLELTASDDGTLVRLHHDLPFVEAIAEHSAMFWRVSLAALSQHFAVSSPRPAE